MKPNVQKPPWKVGVDKAPRPEELDQNQKKLKTCTAFKPGQESQKLSASGDPGFNTHTHTWVKSDFQSLARESTRELLKVVEQTSLSE